MSLISLTPGAINSAESDDFMKTRYCADETFRNPRKPSYVKISDEVEGVWKGFLTMEACNSTFSSDLAEDFDFFFMCI